MKDVPKGVFRSAAALISRFQGVCNCDLWLYTHPQTTTESFVRRRHVMKYHLKPLKTNKEIQNVKIVIKKIILISRTYAGHTETLYIKKKYCYASRVIQSTTNDAFHKCISSQSIFFTLSMPLHSLSVLDCLAFYLFILYLSSTHSDAKQTVRIPSSCRHSDAFLWCIYIYIYIYILVVGRYRR